MAAAFQAAYAIGFLIAGRLTDKLGIRKAFTLAILLWSFAAMTPGAARTVPMFIAAMFILGLGEAANFPACIKTVAEWFPKRERRWPRDCLIRARTSATCWCRPWCPWRCCSLVGGARS